MNVMIQFGKRFENKCMILISHFADWTLSGYDIHSPLPNFLPHKFPPRPKKKKMSEIFLQVHSGPLDVLRSLLLFPATHFYPLLSRSLLPFPATHFYPLLLKSSFSFLLHFLSTFIKIPAPLS